MSVPTFTADKKNGTVVSVYSCGVISHPVSVNSHGISKAVDRLLSDAEEHQNRCKNCKNTNKKDIQS